MLGHFIYFSDADLRWKFVRVLKRSRCSYRTHPVLVGKRQIISQLINILNFHCQVIVIDEFIMSWCRCSLINILGYHKKFSQVHWSHLTANDYTTWVFLIITSGNKTIIHQFCDCHIDKSWLIWSEFFYCLINRMNLNINYFRHISWSNIRSINDNSP